MGKVGKPTKLPVPWALCVSGAHLNLFSKREQYPFTVAEAVAHNCFIFAKPSLMLTTVHSNVSMDRMQKIRSNRHVQRLGYDLLGTCSMQDKVGSRLDLVPQVNTRRSHLRVRQQHWSVSV